MNLLFFVLFLSAVFYKAFIVNNRAVLKQKRQVKSIDKKHAVKQFKPIDTEVVNLINVHDGDTFKCTVKNKELMAVYEFLNIRCYGFDTEELPSANAIRQKNFAEKKLRGADKILLSIIKLDKYGGRFVAKVTLINGGKKTDFTDLMINSAGARPYFGGKK